MHMQRTTIMAEGELLDLAKRIASQDGISLSELIRQGIELRTSVGAHKPSVIGMGLSGKRDTARKHATQPAPPR